MYLKKVLFFLCLLLSSYLKVSECQEEPNDPPISLATQANSAANQAMSAANQPNSARTQPISAVAQDISAANQAMSGASPATSAATQPISTATQAISAASQDSSAATQVYLDATQANLDATQASSAASQANSAGTQPNSAATQPKSAGTQANSAGTQAGSAGTQASSAGTQASSAETQASSARTQPNSETTQANSAATKSDSVANQPKSTEVEPDLASTQTHSTQPSSVTVQVSSVATSANSNTTQPNSAKTQPISNATQPNSASTQPHSAAAQGSSASTQDNSAVNLPKSSEIPSEIDINLNSCGDKNNETSYVTLNTNMTFRVKINHGARPKPKGCPSCISRPADCSDIYRIGNKTSGIYTIYPRTRKNGTLTATVYCDMDTDGGGWTVIQRRGKYPEKINFYRGWKDYKKGFGKLSTEFWLGNALIHTLTTQGIYSLRIDMKKSGGGEKYSQHQTFWIGDEQSRYNLHVSEFTGTAPNDLQIHDKMPFSTHDKPNGSKYVSHQCPVKHTGAWWYPTIGCGFVNLNGMYLDGVLDIKSNWWFHWTGFKGLEFSEMKIRHRYPYL